MSKYLKEILHFFLKKFAYIKKKQYLCTLFRVDVRKMHWILKNNIKYILQCQRFVKLQARKP